MNESPDLQPGAGLPVGPEYARDFDAAKGLPSAARNGMVRAARFDLSGFSVREMRLVSVHVIDGRPYVQLEITVLDRETREPSLIYFCRDVDRAPSKCTEEEIDGDELKRLVWQTCMLALAHELDECLKYDGARLREPHPGEPYPPYDFRRFEAPPVSVGELERVTREWAAALDAKADTSALARRIGELEAEVSRLTADAQEHERQREEMNAERVREEKRLIRQALDRLSEVKKERDEAQAELRDTIDALDAANAQIRAHAAHEAKWERVKQLGDAIRADRDFLSKTGSASAFAQGQLAAIYLDHFADILGVEGLKCEDAPLCQESSAPPQPLRVKRLHPDAKIPERATPGSAGLDLFACLEEPLCIPYGATKKVPLGFAGALPSGLCALVMGRSGNELKGQLTVKLGLVDSDYRGEWAEMVRAEPPAWGESSGTGYRTINPGDKIAQALVLRAELLPVEVVEALDTTSRGEGGFGSTDRKPQEQPEDALARDCGAE